LRISYKPQKISPKFEGTVEQLFQTKIPELYLDPKFQSEVVKPLKIDHLRNKLVRNLSGKKLIL